MKIRVEKLASSNRVLKAKWTPEAAQGLQVFHTIDALEAFYLRWLCVSPDVCNSWFKYFEPGKLYNYTANDKVYMFIEFKPSKEENSTRACFLHGTTIEEVFIKSDLKGEMISWPEKLFKKL